VFEFGRFGPIAWGCLLGLGVVPRLPRLVVLAGVAAISYVVIVPPGDSVWANWAGLVLGAAAFAAMSVLVRRDTGPLAIRPLMAVGRISYGLYLWHYPFALAIWPLLFDGVDRAGDLAWTGAAIGATFACAGVSWLLVERRFLVPRSAESDRAGHSHVTPGIAG
jgi:peptidoglycan/LPS O-acetylase OafA/YrhL